jgi:TatD DNase family protein
MPPKYFDIHSHLNFPQYDKDREDVIKRLKETETETIVIGTNYEDSRKNVELAEKYEHVYACIGVHPVDDPTQIFDPIKFEELVKHPKVVAIGECGLDFFHEHKEISYPRQHKLFTDQIEFAIKYNKPLMIHSRDAYKEMLEILEPLKPLHREKLRGNIHFFAGNTEIAKRFFDIGFTISFTGVITFARDYDEVIKTSPINMILSETDAPFVAPAPYRGTRNEPSYVKEVVSSIAKIRGEDEEQVRMALVRNSLHMIG